MCDNCLHKAVCGIKKDIETDTFARMGIKFNTKECTNYISNETNADKVVDEFMQGLLDGYNLIEWKGKDYKIVIREI